VSRAVVYGRNPARELLAAGRRPAHEVWVLPQLAGEGWLAGAPLRISTKAELGREAGTSDHQGVVVHTDEYPYATLGEVLDGAGPVVVLDGAQDPRNLGAIARVADAAGAAGMVIAARGTPGITPTVAKASAGAVEHLPVARVGSVAGAVLEAVAAGREALGADAELGEDYRSAAAPPDAVLVLGAEGAGLRPRVSGACSRLVRIPMAGRVASLNIAVAAGILMFELRRSV
jgi:23S rRNA (guanosine2251-2'-O)-methyltransferase